MKKILIIIMMFLIIPRVSALETSGQCVIAMDQDSHKIFYAKNIHTQRPIASISKIMTAILAIESDKFTQAVQIGSEIEEAYGSGVYIKQGEHIKIEDLVYGLMLRSGNDAAAAIAHHVGGSIKDFITLMNNKAKELGMKNTTFNNPSGLDDDGGNISTAYDMAILTSYAMKNETYQKIVKTKHYKLETDMNFYSWTNKNKLLTLYKYTTGGKTGFTDVAKRTLVTTASKDNLNLVVVTLNDGNDFNNHKNLYEDIFYNYKNLTVITEGKINILDETHYKNSSFYVKTNFNYPLNNNDKSNIFLKFKIEKKDDHKNDDKIGTVEVYINDEILHEQDVYITKEEVKEKTWFQKLIGWLKW